ncbi:MAG: hypothetical protein ASARMPREDX12_007747 [Alectoria sarmentosa]|nr:MAG: hypothetical protein ASARMPREDX12_007747 [Alectoria sarmentosa]
MGAEPPFLYDHPSKFSFSGPTQLPAFNPKAATHASLSLPTPTSKPDGPLINAKEYNRHPDSYYVAPYGNLDWKPMGPHTKSSVKWTRITQLVLRICELIGAVGWIIRVPPGVAVLHTIYGTYHLSRSAKGRTPSSSASYFLFAAIMDAGLIPFLVFTALISHTQSIEPVNAPSHWSTLLGSDEATTSVVFAIYITSVITGTLHLVSLATSIYLGVIFRKISRLPPDMNPLEDNLTSRHKRNKSSLLDNRVSQISTPTDKLRVAKAEDPLMASPTLPFMHTRNDSYSDVTVLSHPNASARASRTNLSTSFYDQPPAHRSPHTEVRGPFYDLPLSQRSSRAKMQSQNNDQPRSSRKDSRSNITSTPLLNTSDRVSQNDLLIPFYDQPPAHRSSRTEIQDLFYDQHSPSHRSSRTMFPVLSRGESPVKPTNQPTVVRSSTKSSSLYFNTTNPAKQTNQPTIIRSPTKSSSIYSNSTITTIATSRPASIRPGSTAPSLPDKNWITHPSPLTSPSPSPPRELKHLLNKPSYQPLSQTSPFEYTTNSENFRPLEMNPPTPPLNQQKGRGGARAEQRALTPGTGNLGQDRGWAPGMVGIGKAKARGGMGRSGPAGKGGGGRVVSRSGVEVKEGGIFPSGGIRAREVSGKVMEEGRTGVGGRM